jgi:hypothetical protein
VNGPKSLARFAGVVGVALGALAGLAAAVTTTGAARGPGCHPRLSLVARGQGSPDDLVWKGRTLFVSDINGGKIGVLARGRVRTLVSHIREPEGMVPGPANSLIVATQATNSVLQIRLPMRRRTTLARLPLPAGKAGLDGINADGPSYVFVPDSARGRLYVLRLRSRKLSLVASGMTRPVAAIKWGKAVVVADEYANAVWRIRHGRTRIATIPLPDDLTVVSHHLIASSLLGAVWEVAPHLRKLSSAFSPASSDPQGLVADGPDAVLVADESRDAIYRLSRLSGCL